VRRTYLIAVLGGAGACASLTRFCATCACGTKRLRFPDPFLWQTEKVTRQMSRRAE
jgi:hypothetical protein